MMQNLLTKRNIIIALVIVVLSAGIVWYTMLPTGAGQERRGITEVFYDLFPSSGERKPSPEENGGNGEIPPGVPAADGAALQLVQESVSGAMFLKNKVRYIEKSTGHLYEINIDGGEKKIISNTTIPGIFEVTFSSLGTRAILKYESENGLSVISAQFIDSTTKATFLPAGIKDITFSPKGDRIAYVLVSGDNGSIITATPDNKTKTTRLTLPVTSWKLSWVDSNNIYMQTAPSAHLDGFFYRLNVSTGAFTKIFGPAAGLEVSTNGASAILSLSDPNGRTLYNSILNIASGKISSLNLKTLIDKCVWSKKSKDTLFCAVPLSLAAGVYPDDWYKGKISTSDVIVKINTKDSSVSPVAIREGLDADDLVMSEDELSVIFINKKDGSLWRVTLN